MGFKGFFKEVSPFRVPQSCVLTASPDTLMEGEINLMG